MMAFIDKMKQVMRKYFKLNDKMDYYSSDDMGRGLGCCSKINNITFILYEEAKKKKRVVLEKQIE